MKRLFKVLDGQLEKTGAYIAGSEFTIADAVNYPWVAAASFLKFPLDDYPNVKKWIELVGQRPSVQKGMAILA